MNAAKVRLSVLCTSAFVLTMGLLARDAHAVVGDCNNNGVPDAQEASWANRDDDGDGICNGVDTCPYEPNPDQTNTAVCAMQAITVPWIPSNPGFPHSTYSGASTRVKGIARYGGDQFMWDFGDGSPATAWLGISNPYDLAMQHTYSGAPGQLFIATLSVRSSSNTAVVANAFYPVKIQESADLTDSNQMDVRVNMAIDESLWYLHTHLNRSTFSDGSPGYQQPYGFWDNQVGSCAAVDALELHGSQPLQNYSTDPYVEDTRRGLNYMLFVASYSGIGPQDYGNPDTNGNGIGIFLGGNSTYTDGICGLALASSHAPGRVAGTGGPYVYGRAYRDIIQDVVDWFAYGQGDGTDYYRGGWLYSANQGGADGSTNQWPILAMSAAEDNMGATVPLFVRQQIPFFINYSHYTAHDNLNGGWGYRSSTDGYTNNAKTAGGMLAHYFVGDSPNHPDVQAGLGFLYRHWNVIQGCDQDGGNYCSCWNASMGYSYAMYGIMKSMRKVTPNILRITEYDYNAAPNGAPTANSFDWYYTPAGQAQQGLATNLVNRQAADGHWNDNAGCGALSQDHTTAWDALILSKGVTTIPPQAAICNCTATWDINQNVTLDGSCSVDADPTRSIVAWDWDFNYNNSSFNKTASGQTATLVGGFPTYAVHRVALRVTDNNPPALGGGQTSIATCNVIVKPPPHCPQAIIGGPYNGKANQPVQLSALASFDVDNDPITFKWDLHNNNLFADSTSATPTVTFNAPGTYPIAVQVTDHPELNVLPYVAPNCTVSAFTTVVIGNHPPVASAGGPYSGTPNSSVTLSAAASTDPDDDPLTYAWDLSGNGLFNDSTSATPTFNIGAVAPGTTYDLCVKVSDPFGLSNVACAILTVTHPHNPPVCTIISPQVVATCTGGPMQIAVDGSNSYDLNGDPITFQWTTTCAAPIQNASSALTSLTFASANSGCSNTCTAHLTVANPYFSSGCDAQITIVDTNPPTFSTAPQNVTFECTPGTTASVNAWLGNAAATDVCAPSGATVGLANNFVPNGGCGGVGVGNSVLVTWTASNVCGHPGQSSATVSVIDTTAPVVTVPGTQGGEATGPSGLAVSFVTSATDFVSGPTAVTCVPASGSIFPVGDTTVHCSSTDGAGNTGYGTFTVTVTDHTAPVLSLPSPIVAVTGDASTPITFTATATDLVDGPTAVTCTPASGSAFVPGVTTVTCTTADTHGNSISGTFTVTVHLAAPVIDQPTNGSLFYGINLTGADITFAAHGVPNALLTVVDNGVTLAQHFLADGAGHYAGTLTLAYGHHNLSATQSLNGEISPSSATVGTDIQPLLPTIIAPADGFQTTSTTVPLLATGVAGGTLIAFDGGSALPETFLADALGNYSGAYTLDYGPHLLTWRQILSGETSLSTAANHIDVVPPAPVLVTPADGSRGTCDHPYVVSGTAVSGLLASDHGMVNVYEINAGAPTPTAPTRTVAVGGGDTFLGQIAVNSNGTFSQAMNFACGVHTLHVSETLNGETSAFSNANTFTLRPPPPIIVTHPTNPDNHAGFTGTALVAPTPTTLKVYDGGALVYTTTVSTAGGWSFDGLLAPRILQDGQHNLTFTASINGQESDATPFSFMLWTQAPRLVISPPLNGSAQATATQPLGYVYAAGYTPPAGVWIASVAYTFDGAPLYSGAPAGAPPAIDLTMLLPGPHTITLAAVDNLGNADLTPFTSTFFYGPSLDTDIALTKKLLGPLVVLCGCENDGRDGDKDHKSDRDSDRDHRDGDHRDGDHRQCDGDHHDGDRDHSDGDRDRDHHDRDRDTRDGYASKSATRSWGTDAREDHDESRDSDRDADHHHGDDDGRGSAACRKPHLSLSQYRFLLSRLYEAKEDLAAAATSKHPEHERREAVRELWDFTQALLRDARLKRIPQNIVNVLVADVRYLIDLLGGPPRCGDDEYDGQCGDRRDDGKGKAASNDRH